MTLTRKRRAVSQTSVRQSFSSGLEDTTLDYAARRGIEQPIVVPESMRRTDRAGVGAPEIDPVGKPGMFDGLTLKRRVKTPDLGRVEGLAPNRLAWAAPRPGLSLEPAVERYARVLENSERMRAQKLPVLEFQKRELREAGAALDGVRPGATRDLHNALRHEP